MLIDTHCHLDFDAYDPDRAEVLARATAVNVQRVIIPGLDLKNCRAILRLAEGDERLFTAVGVHPNSTADWQDSWLDELRELAQHPQVVAIGEIGLDYYWDKSPPPTQWRAFNAQLDLAVELDLPVIIHNREADEDMIRFLSNSGAARRPLSGVLHSFAGDVTMAQAALALNFYLGFTGPLTYKNGQTMRDVAQQTPLDRLLLETDGPFLAPQQRRGKRNEPAYLVHIAEQLAALHNLTVAEISAITSENAIRLFGAGIIKDYADYAD
jgi:TatD DNase family protein